MVVPAGHGIVRGMNRTRLVSGVIALALAASACGSGDSSDAGTTDPSPATLDTVTVDSVTSDTAAGDDSTVADTTTVTTDEGTPAADGTVADDTAAPLAVPAALQFTAPAVGGGEIDAAQFAGTPTLFWFWAPY
jgi:hypothetical protein